MTAAPPGATPAAALRRRPKDRGQQILRAASRLFRAHGYHQVSMADIAAAVDVGASALYRHFASKQDLFLALLHQDLDHLHSATAAQPDVDGLVEALLARGLERPELAMLWERDSGLLPDAERRALRRRLRELAARLQQAILDRRGNAVRVDRHAALLRAWAAITLIAGPSRHQEIGGHPRVEHLVRAAIRAVLAAPLPDLHDAELPTPACPTPRPAMRREAVLGAAVELFAERGYGAVTMADIAAAAGMAPASVYNHFDGKLELLTTALVRVDNALWLGVHSALAGAGDAADALRRVAAKYIEFGVDNPSMLGVIVAQISVELPASAGKTLPQMENDYVAEWVALLRQARPELDARTAWLLSWATVDVITSLTRTPQLRRRSTLPAHLAALAAAVLAVG